MLSLNLLHKDERGEIYLITGDSLKEHQEITLFVTKKGYARGGCVHKNHDEHCIVLEGNIAYHIGEEYPEVATKGMSMLIPQGEPHYFVSNTDSIVAEWGADPEEKKEKHPIFRKLVEEHNARIS